MTRRKKLARCRVCGKALPNRPGKHLEACRAWATLAKPEQPQRQVWWTANQGNLIDQGKRGGTSDV